MSGPLWDTPGAAREEERQAGLARAAQLEIEALAWARNSYWYEPPADPAGEAAALANAIDCLDGDLADGNANGTSRNRAEKYMAILSRRPDVQAVWAKAQVESARREAERTAVWREKFAALEQVWGTSDADQAAVKFQAPAEISSAWFEDGELWFRATNDDRWLRESPDAEWRNCGDGVGDDPTDYTSGWGNAYGD